MSKSRNWCFTLNNPEPTDKEKILALGVKYVLFQLEEGEQGTPHYQGMIVANSPIRLKSVKEMIPRAHWEQTRSVPASIDYCSKEDSRIEGPWEAGQKPKGRGKRTDLDDVAETIQSGASLVEVAQTYPVQVIKFHRGIQTLRNLQIPPRNEPPEVYVYTGKTGTGKSRKAFEEAPDAYFKPDGDWWDGYDAHEDVIIDDFACDMKLTQLLRLCDRYPMKVPVKGGFAEFVAKRIFITSNIPYDQWYENARQEHRDALTRRITKVVNFSGGLVLPATSVPRT